jgi:hypothetical protein
VRVAVEAEEVEAVPAEGEGEVEETAADDDTGSS